MKDVTVIFVSSNREDPEFENKVVLDLLEKVGDQPIVSVTQKPMNLGKNISIGDVGASGFNFCRQVEIACKVAETPFVISAESDCLYSPDYFKFRPERLDVPYRNTNIYVQKYGQDYVCKKSMSTFSQVVGREFYLSRLEKLFKDMPDWNSKMKNFPKEIRRKLFRHFETFTTEFPCISFKTGKGMRRHSDTDEVPVYDLPYWGNIKELRQKYEVN
jgi:hypothetical protein